MNSKESCEPGGSVQSIHPLSSPNTSIVALIKPQSRMWLKVFFLGAIYPMVNKGEVSNLQLWYCAGPWQHFLQFNNWKLRGIEDALVYPKVSNVPDREDNVDVFFYQDLRPKEAAISVPDQGWRPPYEHALHILCERSQWGQGQWASLEGKEIQNYHP